LVQLHNLSSNNLDSIVWNFGDGTRSTTPNTTHLYNSSGNFVIILTAYNPCGAPSLSRTITIRGPQPPQILKSANDTVASTSSGFRIGVNMKYTNGWTDEQVSDIASGSLENRIEGIGSKAIRTTLPYYFTSYWGEDIRKDAFQHYVNNDLRDNVMTIGYPDSAHLDPTVYCPEKQAFLFKDIYTDIWDNGANGTPVNDQNTYALYVYRMAKAYKGKVKFWEIWDTPGYDEAGVNGWKPRGLEGNWWESNPSPCEYGLHAPIQHLVRMMRISYEVIKSVDPDAFVMFSGAGYTSFLDAVCRNTDNPIDGTSSTGFPLKGGAYFDAISYKSFPHFDGSTSNYDPTIGGLAYHRNSDASAKGIKTFLDSLQAVLNVYGYNGIIRPKKRFLVSECNIPRKTFTGSFGSDEIQKNFITKAYITAATNGIAQLHVKSISEDETLATATDPSQLMGLFQKLTATVYNRTKNIEAIAYKTTSEQLYSLVYDTNRTLALNLPQSVKGAAFKNSKNKYTYVLWALTTGDLTEYATASYNFPTNFGLPQLYKREWDYSETNRNTPISAQNIPLSGSPIFIVDDTTVLRTPVSYFTSDAQHGCPTLTVHFTDFSRGDTTRLWHFPGGTPATSTAQNPSVTYPRSGNYDVSLDAINTQGSHTFTRVALVNVDSAPIPVFGFSIDSGVVVRFDNQTRGTYTMIWDFGDSTPQNRSYIPPAHRYNQRRIYYVKLIAINDCGRDSVTKIIDLRNIATSEQKAPNPVVSMTAYPNPFDDHIVLKLDLEVANELEISLLDITGMQILLNKNKLYSQGTHEISLDTNGLAHGLYLCQVKLTDGRVLVRKVIKF
jgi:PKD repeat protein